MASGLNLFVVPLDRRVDDEILRNAFSEYGELFSAQVAKDENGVSKNFGFVHFCSVNDGLRAKDEMDNKAFFGRIIHIKIAHKQEGRCYKDRSKNSGGEKTWSSSLNVRSLDDTQEQESVSDVLSQYSDATTNESNPVETPNVKERMRKLFESQSFTDVTFYPKNNRRISISAHRAVLAISSPLFTKMLFDDQNKLIVGEKLEVQISNLSFDAFTCIVKYLYTDEVSFENDTLVQGIFDGAKQFGIYSLVNKCREYFENVELTNENVCSKLQVSTSNKITVLKERCIEFIQRNTLSVIQTTDFQKCNSTTMHTICKLQSLNLRSEMELLEAMMQWLHSQPYHERKTLLEPLLKCIRFLNLTVGEMGDALKKYPTLMTSDEGLSIMLFLYNPPQNPNFTSLPSWCNKNMSSRCFFKEDVQTSQVDLNSIDSSGKLVSKIFFPLKSDPEQGFVSELTSLLQLKCISGFHEIKAIRLRFERPMSTKSCIKSVLINVHVRPSGFNTKENVQIINSESVRIEFTKIIKARRGDIVDIGIEAKNIELYKFLQFDEKSPMPANPHFNISISSLPKLGKLYFISDIEYGPQDGPKFPPKNWKSKRNPKK